MIFSINMLFVFVGTERTFWADISVPSRQGVSSDGDMALQTYIHLHFFSCVTTVKVCLMTLLITAIIAAFPSFPFNRKRSKHARHSVLHRNAAIAPT